MFLICCVDCVLFLCVDDLCFVLCLLIVCVCVCFVVSDGLFYELLLICF